MIAAPARTPTRGVSNVSSVDSSTASSSSTIRAASSRSSAARLIVSWRRSAATFGASPRIPWMMLTLAMLLVLLGAARAALGQTTSDPSTGAALDTFGVERLALLLYTAAMHGEWRMVIAASLVAVAMGVRWATARFRRELEAETWYRDYVLPWVPVVIAVLAAVGIDGLAGKPFGASFWRAVGLGATGGWMYKALRPLWRLALSRLFPASHPPPPAAGTGAAAS